MPRISAPSLQEHREARREKLLAAARELLLANGPEGLTLGAVATRAGLARPSLYEYFPSRDHLVAALVEQEAPAWLEDVRRAMAAAPTPLDQVGAFVRAQLDLFAAGKHRVGAALGGGFIRPGSEAARKVAATHGQVYAMLERPLTALQVRDRSVLLRLAAACVGDAIRQLKSGEPRRQVTRAAVAFVVGAVRACATRPDPTSSR